MSFQQVYNLTIATLHTYYIRSGAADVLVHNCGAAAKTAEGGVDLFRHVSPAELADIQKSGAFRPGSGSMEGKWFAESGEHAQRWGSVLNGGEGSTVTTRVPSSVADKMMRMDKLDGIGPARYASNLDELNSTMNGVRLWP